MYSTCLFCSASLGRNEAIEAFAVGERVAFDAARGRLWAVCGRCGRWNLAPLEERWEAVEQAERLFTDTRSRVHTEHIGLARLRDGTRLVRVGAALPGEIAAWRYGTQLVSRRNRNIAVTGAAVAAGVALVAGMPFIASAGLPIGLLNGGLQLGSVMQMRRQRLRVVHRIDAADSPSGADIVIRRWHLYHAALGRTADGDVALDMPSITDDTAPFFGRMKPAPAPPLLRLEGDTARRVIARSMTDFNHNGASKTDVARALTAIEAAGGADAFARNAAASGAAIIRAQRAGGAPGASWSIGQILGTFRGGKLPVVKYRNPFTGDDRPRLSKTDALALEMALQDEAERRALEGELAALEAAWREAEEIARIADALPGEPPA
jgi:hypothetical protein